MAECAECGAALEQGATKCAACGAPAGTASFAPVPAEVERPETSAFPGVKGPALVVHKGLASGERFLIDRPRLAVGRDPSSDIFLNDVTVSRDHAVLTLSGDDVTLTDSGSLNGTYVNDELVESAVLNDGDLVQIGTFCMTFVGPRES